MKLYRGWVFCRVLGEGLLLLKTAIFVLGGFGIVVVLGGVGPGFAD